MNKDINIFNQFLSDSYKILSVSFVSKSKAVLAYHIEAKTALI